ncbi:50S ribosomal protein L29 [Miltoncostaea marina]|uniref:50S ribosomal protein L29 n=1 Tax=Miltoncostaea marina TaxID=2843215 RepID=UPI001C3CABAD|nr:50S ribosomal protein L29 [Miltoncostaea marina]
MKPNEIRDLSDDELAQRLAEAREAHFNLRFQHASGALERTSELSARRREIARLLTIARERELQA